MEAIEFVANYENYLTEIEQVVKPEFLPVIEKLRAIDPHDLVRPDTWFQGSANARGYVWLLFLKEKSN
jgi:hypothetical protein